LTSGYSIIQYIIKSSDDYNIWAKEVLAKMAIGKYIRTYAVAKGRHPWFLIRWLTLYA
jgi:hypothetical protein